MTLLRVKYAAAVVLLLILLSGGLFLFIQHPENVHMTIQFAEFGVNENNNDENYIINDNPSKATHRFNRLECEEAAKTYVTPPSQIHQEKPQKKNQNACQRDPFFALHPDLPKPDYFVIGVAKGGTTSFENYIEAHPNVGTIRVKEPNFFTWKYMNTDDYQNMFTKTGDILKIGEYSTANILHPLAPRRIRREVPDAKIILLLRNPIDRAYSHYTMTLRSHVEHSKFEKIMATEMQEVDELRYRFRECFNEDICNITNCLPREILHRHKVDLNPFVMLDELDMKDFFFSSYLFRSLYDDQIERWLSVFPREQIMIIESEELYSDTTGTMEAAAEFLGLPYFNFSTSPVLYHSWGGGPSNIYSDAHHYIPMLNDTRRLLDQFFEPYNQRLFSIIGKEYSDWKLPAL